jgi:hypothetical protein
MDNVYRTLDLGITGQVIANRPAVLTGYYIFNNAAAVRFVKLYNQAAPPTNANTPIATLPIPAGGGANLFSNAGLAAAGLNFTNGLAIRATTGLADADNTAPAANDVVVNIFYR